MHATLRRITKTKKSKISTNKKVQKKHTHSPTNQPTISIKIPKRSSNSFALGCICICIRCIDDINKIVLRFSFCFSVVLISTSLLLLFDYSRFQSIPNTHSIDKPNFRSPAEFFPLFLSFFISFAHKSANLKCISYNRNSKPHQFYLSIYFCIISLLFSFSILLIPLSLLFYFQFILLSIWMRCFFLISETLEYISNANSSSSSSRSSTKRRKIE